ncbi:MAG: Xaa-Pro aminopeptidase [Marinagarivorans sp.]|nr:Xaa-Pro aminopeptidase [Marinagarivorans sp.]
MRLSAQTFAKHRAQLMAKMSPGSIAIIPAAGAKPRSRDTNYRYRPDSDFYYLSGFEEPDALLILAPGNPKGEFIVFCRPRDKQKEIWEGIMAGPEGVLAQFGADAAFSIHQADQHIPELMDGRAKIYTQLGQCDDWDKQVMTWLRAVRAKARSGACAPEVIADINAELHELRLIKGEEEQLAMAASCELAAQAHVRAMQYCQAGRYEYQLEAEILHGFAMSGAMSAAYNTIVGGGKNACILHYINNDQPLKEGDLVLIDAGCELDYYAADITRTFPVNGRFSAPQKALYELVLKAQEAAFAVIKPGTLWNEPHDVSVRVLTEGLVELGLLSGDVDELVSSGAYKAFYMHRVGHWLGMDVHDVGAYKIDGQWRPLMAGMAMTVEPGLYISPDDMSVDEKWRGIGIRIEDDVIVTAEGYRVLTDGVPKTVEDIERLMAG